MYRRNRVTVRQAREADRIAARKKIERGTHGLVLHVQGGRSAGEVAEIASRALHWWEDLRMGRNKIYGSLLRFIDISVANGASREMLMHIPHMIAFYIADQIDDRDAGQHRKPAA